MNTAFLYPGLNALKRNKDRARFLSQPYISEHLQDTSQLLHKHFGLRINAQKFLSQSEQFLYSNGNVAITAVYNTTIQVAISLQLKRLIASPVCIMGYSQGDVARSVYAGMISMEEAIINSYEFFNAINIDRYYGENIGIRASKPCAFTSADIQWFSEMDVEVSQFTPYYLICSVNLQQLELIRKLSQQKKWVIKHSVFKYPVHSKLIKNTIEHVLTKSIRHDISLKSPWLPVYSSVLNKPISRVNDVRQEARIGLYSPIHWLQGIYAIVNRYQVNTIINIGPCRSISLMLRETPLKIEVHEADKLLAGIS